MKSIYDCLLICFLVPAVGCHVGYFHTETELSPDGSVERAILQPVAGTPDEALESTAWDESRWSAEKTFGNFDGGIRDLPLTKRKKDYFAAWMKVGSAADLPEHFTKSAVDQNFTSHFERHLERRDLGILIEFTWEETLTDVVTLEDFRKARQEAIDLFCEILEPALTHSQGAEYDTSKLMAWIRNEGAAFVFEVTDVAYDYERSLAQTLRDKSQEETLKKLVLGVCEKHGFAGLLDENGAFHDKVAEQHALRIIEANVVRRDGAEFNLEDFMLLVFGEKNGEKSSTDSRFEKEWDRVVKSRPGGVKTLEKQYRDLTSRIGGVHRGLISKSTEDFRFTMKFPGVVVQTNGILRSDNQIRWQFHSYDAWPAGFTMTGQSLLDDSGSINELRQWRQSLNPGSLTRLRELAARDVRLVDVLKKCREGSHLTPLLDLANSSEDTDLAFLADRVLKVLLPVEGK
jgi:hypothetical protein